MRHAGIADMVPRNGWRAGRRGRRTRAIVSTATVYSVPIERKYVNMADVNFKSDDDAGRDGRRAPQRAPIVTPLSLADQPEIAFIELLFFAYRDFISDPDAALLDAAASAAPTIASSISSTAIPASASPTCSTSSRSPSRASAACSSSSSTPASSSSARARSTAASACSIRPRPAAALARAPARPAGEAHRRGARGADRRPSARAPSASCA